MSKTKRVWVIVLACVLSLIVLLLTFTLIVTRKNSLKLGEVRKSGDWDIYLERNEFTWVVVELNSSKSYSSVKIPYADIPVGYFDVLIKLDNADITDFEVPSTNISTTIFITENCHIDTLHIADPGNDVNATVILAPEAKVDNVKYYDLVSPNVRQFVDFNNRGVMFSEPPEDDSFLKYGEDGLAYVIGYSAKNEDINSIFAYDTSRNDTIITLPKGTEQIAEFCFASCNANTYFDNLLLFADNKYILQTWYSLSESMKELPVIEEIVLPDGLREVCEYGFAFSTVRKVILPDSLELLDECAFLYCPNLESITIPDSIDYIPTMLCAGCNNLKDVTLHEGITSIDALAFADCASLEYLDIPKSVKTIVASAFNDTSVTLELHDDVEFLLFEVPDGIDVFERLKNVCVSKDGIKYTLQEYVQRA